MRPTAATLVAALLVATAAPARAQQVDAPPKDLDAYVARVMRQFQVPGIGLAIVKDGRVLVAKGYGVRKLGDTARVTPRTNFGIASNTKIFTATALALLVEEGKLEWDAPVIRYLPSFAMWDPFVTRELTIRDLLVHRSGLGLGAGDLLWWPASTYDRREIVRRLRFIRPATSFRTAYAYDNVLYTVAGEVIEAVTGRTWEDFVQERLLARVGMTGSNVRHSDAMDGRDAATPHAEVEGRVRPIAPFLSDNVNPAGGINAGAADMAKWMIVQLDSGRLADGTRLWSPASTRQLWTGVTPMPIGAGLPELAAIRPSFNLYALGLGTWDYRGHKLLSHTGGLPGYVSRVAMVPDRKLGVVVLTNQESGEAFNAIVNRVLDHFLGAAPIDYPGIYARQRARSLAQLDSMERRAGAARDTASRPSLPLARYAGRYEDPWYGEVTIAEENGKLVLRFGHTPSLVADLEHWQYDTFVARWRDRELRADAFVTFALNPDGTIDQAKMRAVSELTDFSYDFQDLVLKRK